MLDIFGIGETPIYFQPKDGGRSILNPDKPQYFLPRIATVNEEGVIIHEASEEDYIFDFARRIKKPISHPTKAFLSAHLAASVNKEKYLKVVRRVVFTHLLDAPPAITYLVNEWLEENQIQKLKPEKPLDPDPLLSKVKLKKIFIAFDDVLWEEIDPDTFYKVFDLNDFNVHPFKVKNKNAFYALLYFMWKVSGKVGDKEVILAPFLERYGLSPGSFKNIFGTYIKPKALQHREILKKITDVMNWIE